MATAASASPGAFGAKTPAPARGLSTHRALTPSPAFARPSPRTPACGRSRASLHLGGVGAASSSSAAGGGNGTGLHVPPTIAPLAVPKMAGSMKPHKNVLLFYCEEMRDLAQQVVARNDDIELRSISWRSHHLPLPFSSSIMLLLLFFLLVERYC